MSDPTGDPSGAAALTAPVTRRHPGLLRFAARLLGVALVTGSPAAWADASDAPHPRADANPGKRDAAVVRAPLPLPPSAVVAPPPPPDPCTLKDSLAITAEVEQSLGPGRAAEKIWADAVRRCPTPATQFRLGAAHGLVAQQEHSLVHQQQALGSYRAALDLGPTPEGRAILEQRISDGKALLEAWRARPLLLEARAAAARDDSDLALARYDEYLKLATADPERPAVEKERALVLARFRGDRDREASRRHVTGGVLLGVGVVAAAAGGALIALSISAAKEARSAETLGRFDSRLANATYQYVGGIALAGVGAAAAITGVVRLAMGKKELPQALWLAPTTSGMAAGGAF